jgi:serine/threonine-protein kinase
MAAENYRWREKRETLPRTVDAATTAGRLVFFNVAYPTSATSAVTTEQTEGNKVFVFVVMATVFVAAGVYLCLRNLRLGRGDKKTAALVAISLFILGMIEWICLTSHADSIQAERDLVSSGLSAAVMFSVVTCIYYLAIEPYVRRYWPQALASWCRVFEGKFRDPLVGRDILLGTLGGVVSMVLVALLVLAPPWFGYLPTMPYRHWDIDTLQQYIGSPMAAFGGAASLLRLSMRVGIVSLLMLFLLRIILRNRWLAIMAFMGIAIAARVERVPIWYIVIIVAWVSPGMLLLVRYGLIACITWFYSFFLLSMPLTASSRWYVGYGVFFSSIVFGFALYGFLTTMAGRPLVSDERLAGS